MSDEKKTYIIPIIWTWSGYVTVEATTEAEAKKVAEGRQWLESDIQDLDLNVELVYDEIEEQS